MTKGTGVEAPGTTETEETAAPVGEVTVTVVTGTLVEGVMIIQGTETDENAVIATGSTAAVIVINTTIG